MSALPTLQDELADQFGIRGQLPWRLLPMLDRYPINWMSAASYTSEDELDCDRRTFFKIQEQFISAGLAESTGRVTDAPESADFPQILTASGHARRRLTPLGRALVAKHRERKESRYQVRLSKRLRKLARKAEAKTHREGKRETAKTRAATPRLYREFPRDPAPRRWSPDEIDAAMDKASSSFEAVVQGGTDPPK